MDSGCTATTFHLLPPRGATKKGTPQKELVLMFRRGSPGIALRSWVSADWLNVDAKLCDAGTDQCETAAGKIHLDFVDKNGKHASGSFIVDFPSAGHEEGKFTVKYHHDGPKFQCM